jgi:hypothetical protein
MEHHKNKPMIREIKLLALKLPWFLVNNGGNISTWFPFINKHPPT